MFLTRAGGWADPMDELMAWVYETVHECAYLVWTWAMEAGGVRPPETSIVAPVHEGMTVLVFASYAVMVVVGGLIVMGHETVQSRHSVKEVLPRLVLGLGLAWASPLILDGAVNVTGDVVSALIDLNDGGLEHTSITATDPKSLLGVVALMYIAAGVTEESLMAVLSVVLMLIGTVALLVSAVMRWLAMLAVVALAPLALACHGLPQTEGAARLWWRMLAACMGSCIGQAGCLFLWRYIVFDTEGVARSQFDTFPDDASGFYLGVLYMFITIWAMWKVHNEAFRWARGRPLRIPGARMVAGMVAWRAADRLGLKRHQRSKAKSRGSTTDSESSGGKQGLPRFRLSPGWKGTNGGSRAIRVRRPQVDADRARRAKAKAGQPAKPRRFTRSKPEPLVVDAAAPAGARRTATKSPRPGAAPVRTAPPGATTRRRTFTNEPFGTKSPPAPSGSRSDIPMNTKRFARAQRELHPTRRPRKAKDGEKK